MHDDPQPAEAVEVYWRPGCGFCSTLRRDLHRTGLPLREINIWNDQDAATLVRQAAGGSETVPTVVIGPHALVSPTVDEVMAAVAAHAPHLLPTQQPRAPRARVSGRGWVPLASLGLAAVWVGLAVWHPTTTYHLGPVLTAAAWPRLARGLARKPLQPVVAVVATAGGTAAALGALALLAVLHALQGPTLLGGGSPIGAGAGTGRRRLRLRPLGGQPPRQTLRRTTSGELNTGPGPLNPTHPFPADAPRSRMRTRTSCEDTEDSRREGGRRGDQTSLGEPGAVSLREPLRGGRRRSDPLHRRGPGTLGVTDPRREDLRAVLEAPGEHLPRRLPGRAPGPVYQRVRPGGVKRKKLSAAEKAMYKAPHRRLPARTARRTSRHAVPRAAARRR